ncbi:MAG: acyl-CoA reductase [Byssovorax sp.]
MVIAPSRRARVLDVIALGARIADPADPLGREARHTLIATSGLSVEGVELALTRHLETSISAPDLDALLAWCGESPRAWVVLSANVCTAALRAVALALATSPSVRLRPSRREPGLAPLLARELAARGLDVALVEQLDPAPGDEAHAYGSDESLQAIARALPPGVRFRGHGTGLGVAVIGQDAGQEEAALALAGDLVAFDQRGCLSPRVALVDADERWITSFFDVLHRTLLDHGARVPRGPLDEATRSALALHRASAEAIGEVRAGPHHLLALDLAPRALLLPPAARVLGVVRASAGTAGALLGPIARHVTTVGSMGGDALVDAVRALAPGARAATLGEMQRPPLDGPVDRR